MRACTLALLLVVVAVQPVLADEPVDVLAVASIVKGEMEPGCWTGALLVDCTVLDDVETRGAGVLRVCPTCRWHGYRYAFEHDMATGAVYAALNGGCDVLPRCRYLGNARDWHTFRNYRNVVSAEWFCGRTMVCVMDYKVRPARKYEYQ